VRVVAETLARGRTTGPMNLARAYLDHQVTADDLREVLCDVWLGQLVTVSGISIAGCGVPKGKFSQIWIQ
jgi:hypothetical protein